MNFLEYAFAFQKVRENFVKMVVSHGLPFSEEDEPREARMRVPGCLCENGASSVRRGWMSPACEACRLGEGTMTFFVSLKCTRNCYYCFNPNQDEYERFCHEERDIVSELERLHELGLDYKFLAVTGGEPMLHEKTLVDFLIRAKQLYPGVHTRVYTSGDCMGEASLRSLHDAGLDEIRFSVKSLEKGEDRRQVLAKIALARGYVPDVVVEMPVIPGSLEGMKSLLLELDDLGISGINLLEFCYPFNNTSAFLERGFKIRKDPYAVLYNYWYAGGLPVHGSESEALELMRFASERSLAIGVHYCSSDNKNTGQIYQQNKPFASQEKFAKAYPMLSFDESDYFLKCGKAFGGDVAAVSDYLSQAGVLFECDMSVPAVSFQVGMLAAVAEAVPSAQLCESYNVVEQHGRDYYVREVEVRAVPQRAVLAQEVKMVYDSNDLEVVLAARSLIYGVFRSAFGEEPLLERYRSVDADVVRAAFDLLSPGKDTDYGRVVDEALMFPPGVSGREEEAFENLSASYAELFFGPAKMAAPPWESVYATKERVLFQESTLNVRNAYRREGLLPSLYPHVADDHLALELDFMQKLSDAAAEALLRGDEAGRSGKLRASLEFLENHLLVWVPDFVAEISKSSNPGHYLALGLALVEFLKVDRAIVSENLPF